MSPEQFSSSQDVDTRSDVYCFGVLLHELLAGRHPFSGASFSSLNFGDLTELIQKIAPQDLSKISDLPAEDLNEIARARSIEPRKLCAMLREDLNWIVRKCLEKDRNDRYASANGLAADVERYLSDLPVVAGPSTTRYRVAKFVKRMCAIETELKQPHPQRLMVLGNLQAAKGDIPAAIKSIKAAMKVIDKANTSQIERLQQVIRKWESQSESTNAE